MRYFILFFFLAVTVSAQDIRNGLADSLLASTSDTSNFYDLTKFQTLNSNKAPHLVTFEIWSTAPDTLRVHNLRTWGLGTSFDSAWAPCLVYSPLVAATEDTLIKITRLVNGKYFAEPTLYRPLTSGKIRITRNNPGKGRTHKLYYFITTVSK